jgi:hypothetical protein
MPLHRMLALGEVAALAEAPAALLADSDADLTTLGMLGGRAR